MSKQTKQSAHSIFNYLLSLEESNVKDGRVEIDKLENKHFEC